MKIALITNAIYDPLPDWVRYTDATKAEYCRRQKTRHEMIYVRTSDMPHPELHPMWQKPAIMLQYAKRFDWIIWMDADAGINNQDADVPAYLATADNSRIVMSKGNLGWNAGVLAVPCTEPGLDWLRRWEDLRNEPAYQTGWRDQHGVIALIKENPSIVQIPPVELGWNCYPWMSPCPLTKRSWCLHMPNCSADRRTRTFRKLVEEQALTCR